MNVTESTCPFDCQGQRLLGIRHQPDLPGPVGVLVIVGGPQYRAGSHRQFVSLARRLAAAGYPVLRFDVRGMGDCEGSQRSFEDLDDDIAAALDAFTDTPVGPRRVVLWGLCDGASAALLYLARCKDERVAGVALVNPWVRSEQSLARTQVKHYYLDRLRQREFWVKLLSGGVAVKAARDLLRNLRAARGGNRAANGQPGGAAHTSAMPFQQRMAAGWRACGGPILLLLSSQDYTAREFTEYSANDSTWRQAMDRHAPQTVVLEGADHTCSIPGAQPALEQALLQWLAQLAP